MVIRKLAPVSIYYSYVLVFIAIITQSTYVGLNLLVKLISFYIIYLIDLKLEILFVTIWFTIQKPIRDKIMTSGYFT